MSTGIERVAVVFDTFAWVEHLGNGPRADRVEEILVAKHIGTPVIVLAELAHLYATRAPEKLHPVLAAVEDRSAVLTLTREIAVAAGRTRTRLAASRKGIGLVDCLILETARAHGAMLLTGDPHLKGLEGVEFVG